MDIQTLKPLFLAQSPIIQALIATTFTWMVTAAGASLVFFFKTINRQLFDGMLGFTGGVMIAASYWSLLAPAIEITPATNPGLPIWLPAAVGFLAGAMVLFGLDKLMPHIHINAPEGATEGVKTKWNRTILLVLAITLHNIPEGLAIGVAFGAIAHGLPGYEIGAAVALAIGIGIQNFPEGIAVSMPLRRQGLGRFKSFWYGQLSAIVEPIAGFIGTFAVLYAMPILPFALAFAAGAMIYVVVEEVIPETQMDKYADTSTLGFIGGFIVMMVLDVALG